MPETESNRGAATGANVCALCGEPVALGETAVAVRNPDGSPGVVHPACYPRFAMIAKAAVARQAREAAEQGARSSTTPAAPASGEGTRPPTEPAPGGQSDPSRPAGAATPAETLRPVLRQTEAEAVRRLQAACDAATEDVSRETTDELLRIEDALFAALRAVEQTVTIRRVVEHGSCTDEGPGSGAGAAGGESPPCRVRDFNDGAGRVWRVWQVIPGRVRPKQDLERYLGVYHKGWLAFEALDDGSRRRLLDYPDDWPLRTDEELVELLERAVAVPPRRGVVRGAETGADAKTTTDRQPA